jgi:hypothetical protein
MAFLSGKLNRWVRSGNNSPAARAAEAPRPSFDRRIHLRTTKPFISSVKAFKRIAFGHRFEFRRNVLPYRRLVPTRRRDDALTAQTNVGST